MPQSIYRAPFARPAHLFLSESGDLFDTRRPSWHTLPPVRRQFAYCYRTIETPQQLLATLRTGGWAWPGGYTIALYTSDGEMASIPGLLADRSALQIALRDIRDRISGRIVGADIYHEGPTVQCCYTNADIESAYGDPDEEN